MTIEPLLKINNEADIPNAFWQLGYPDQARARSWEALSLAEKLSHAYVLAVTRLFCGYYCADCRHIQTVLGGAEAGTVLAAEYGFLTLLPQMMVQRGWALVHLGSVEEGLDHISQRIAILPTAVQGVRHLFRRFVIDAYLKAKRVEDGYVRSAGLARFGRRQAPLRQGGALSAERGAVAASERLRPIGGRELLSQGD
jgi:hypothetical protein